MDDNILEKLAFATTKALGYTENGGKPDVSNPPQGKTGEMKSIFQFTPDTWKKYSSDVFGKEVPLTGDNETYVVNEKVKNWIKEGKTVKQIASIWNAGATEPDAYMGTFSTGKQSVGINQKYGVKYNVPEYANKVLNYSKQFYNEQNKPNDTSMKSNPTLDAIVAFMKSAGKKQTKQPTPSKDGLMKQFLAKSVKKMT